MTVFYETAEVLENIFICDPFFNDISKLNIPLTNFNHDPKS